MRRLKNSTPAELEKLRSELPNRDDWLEQAPTFIGFDGVWRGDLHGINGKWGLSPGQLFACRPLNYKLNHIDTNATLTEEQRKADKIAYANSLKGWRKVYAFYWMRFQ